MSKFAPWVYEAKASVTREILRVTERRDIISFAGGNPAPELFPVDELPRSFARALTQQSEVSLQYSPTEGYLPLRQEIAAMMAVRGVKCDPEEIGLLHGSQQGLDLLARLYLEPGDLVLVEELSFHGLVNALAPYSVRYRGVPMDEQGMDMDALRQTLQQERPKLIYTMPTFHNPSGITMSAERRQTLANLCAEFEVPLIEDDPYGELRYEGERQPVAKAYDKAGLMHYLSSFSKILVPALRLGWVVAPREVVARINILQMGASVQTGTLVQHAVNDFLQRGLMPGHIQGLCDAYRERRNTLQSGLAEELPDLADWTRPEGGFFLWGKLAKGFTTSRLFKAALEQNVVFIAGDPFFVAGGAADDTLRLSFSTTSPDVIRAGVSRLAMAVHARV